MNVLQKYASQINCLDLGAQHKILKQEIFRAFEQVYDNTCFSGGPFVEDFEREFAAFCQTKYAIGVSNGTTALQLAMLALGIGHGDEVIVPANTFIATAWGVSHTGATPVFVDCDPETWEIDPDKVAEAITSRTKAVIGVHLYGMPFNVERLAEVCKSNHLYLIEDAAQAQGARYKGQVVGGFGEMGCFSFYPGKNLGACGEAGGITTNSQHYNAHLQSLRNHGSKIRYYHDEIGFNMRMGGLEAASLSVKLKYLQEWNAQRTVIAARYKTEIENDKISMQQHPEEVSSVYHLFVVQVDDREAFVQYMNEWNIFPAFHYPVPCHLQKAYAHLGYRKGDCPHAEKLAAHCVSLPIYSELPPDAVSYIIDLINQY